MTVDGGLPSGVKGIRVIGETFVYLQSSRRVLGKPSSANCVIAALRIFCNRGFALAAFPFSSLLKQER